MIRWTTKATVEPMRVSHMQASNAVDVLMKYFEQIAYYFPVNSPPRLSPQFDDGPTVAS